MELDELKRHEQHSLALLDYEPRHTDREYIDFLEIEGIFSVSPSGSPVPNFPKFYTAFTISSQHVQGDCIRECLDNAMEK